jgi:hypothetical protein
MRTEQGTAPVPSPRFASDPATRSIALTVHAGMAAAGLLLFTALACAAILFSLRARDAEETRDTFWLALRMVERFEADLLREPRTELERLLDAAPAAARDRAARAALLRRISESGLLVAYRQGPAFDRGQAPQPSIDAQFISRLGESRDFVVAQDRFYLPLPASDRDRAAQLLGVRASDLLLAASLDTSKLTKVAREHVPGNGDITFFPADGAGFRLARSNSGPAWLSREAYKPPSEVRVGSTASGDYDAPLGLLPMMLHGGHTTGALHARVEPRDDGLRQVFYVRSGPHSGEWAGFAVSWGDPPPEPKVLSGNAIIAAALGVVLALVFLSGCTVRDLRKILARETHFQHHRRQL